MQPIISLHNQPNLDTLVLLAGDGDFFDMVKFMKEILNKKVYLVGWSASMNEDLRNFVGDVIYLDAIWQNLSTSKVSGEKTNSEVLKGMEFRPVVIEAATKQYPNPEQLNLCIDFAVTLSK